MRYHRILNEIQFRSSISKLIDSLDIYIFIIWYIAKILMKGQGTSVNDLANELCNFMYAI